MSLYEFLLFVHVLAAFLTIASVTVYVSVLLATRGAGSVAEVRPLLRLHRLGGILWGIGGGLVLLFGIALAIEVDGYELWDPWIVAAYVLWLLAGFAGTRVAAAYAEALADGAPPPAATIGSSRSLAMHALMALTLAAFLVDMIYKPGA